MRDLLLPLLLLACPLMMVFMMRGMHGGHDKAAPGQDRQAGHHGSDSSGGQASVARIAQLEREVASLRAVQGEQLELPEPRRVPRQ